MHGETMATLQMRVDNTEYSLGMEHSIFMIPFNLYSNPVVLSSFQFTDVKGKAGI